ncbi:MAG TPA: GGDEF domain-containing protein [Solirubrobacteraceae bacterium]|nr:GGDEF domain-containing protein [Solirubrobacteraceae bacterium]
MTAQENERLLSDLDRSSSEADQGAADADQTISDADQTASDRDQASADHDQHAADMDQHASDGVDSEVGGESLYEQTRQMRAASTLERGVTSLARVQGAAARDDVARRRDRLSAARDAASSARDDLAAALDADAESLERQQLLSDGAEHNGTSHVRLRAANQRQLAARAQAAAQRRAAAEDRARAAGDRDLAALDRLAYAAELASAEVDEVTGALRRRVGLAALQREMDRVLRTKEQLTVVFIDVDGLKQVNDDSGHAAGDDLLRTVVQCVTEEFRSYDLILRFGGDEFVCSLSGDSVEEIGGRFDRIATRLSEAIPCATISTGVSERRPQDTAETLIGRADEAMIAKRRNGRTSCQPK